MVPQLPRPRRTRHREIAFFHVGIGTPQRRIGQRKIWINLHRPLEERHTSAACHVKLPARAESLQRLQRRCCRLSQRSVVFLNRGKRLTQPLSEPSRNLAERIQYIFFLRYLHLLLVEHVTAAAALRLQLQHILAPQWGNRTLQYGSAPRSFAHSP